MEIKRDNVVIADVYLKNTSAIEEEIMGEHTVTLVFDSYNTIDLKINDYITVDETIFSIRNNEKVIKKEKSLGWEYTVVFYAPLYRLLDVPFFLHGKPERKKNFDFYNGSARQMVELIVKNMNREDSGWSVGSVIETDYYNFNFRDKSCSEVLNDIVNAYETEYWITNKTINIGRREYSGNGLVLGQGQGKGFKELTLTSVDETPPITILYPYGSDKNITTDYGNDYLILPGGQLSIEKNIEKYGRIGRHKQFDNIFPKGEFTVSSVVDILTFYATDIDFDLRNQLIDNVEAIVTFQGTSPLSGYDFAINADKSDLAARKIVLKPNDQENALKVPGDINFQVGDKFILTGIKMPQKYIDEAENKLKEVAQKYLDENCDKRVQLDGKCDDIYFKVNKTFIACGMMIGVVSRQLNIDREIRCTRTKKYLENDTSDLYRYEITVSDFLQSNGLKDLVNEVKEIPDEIRDAVNPVKEYTKRNWQDVIETMKMMFDPNGEFQEELTSSIVGHFGQVVVGASSQQMDLIGVRFIPNADNDPNLFRSTAGRLEHFTVNGDGSIRTWDIGSSEHRLNNNIAYYVYAKCSRTTQAGTILVTDQKIQYDQDPDFYHFWIGVLNTPIDNVRSWQPLYGYTEIAGQQITTGIIKDRLARLVINLIEGTIYGQITFAPGTSGYNNITDAPNLSYYDQAINNALQDMENVSNAANQAISAAHGKATVFYSTWEPGANSGRKLNDIWVNGTDIKVFDGSQWQLASKYDVTETVINGGLITTGAISFGGTGGMAATGSARIWSGGAAGANGQPPSNPTFRVLSNGSVYARNSINVEDANGDNVAGFSSEGTNWGSPGQDNPGSIRIWAGSNWNNKENAPFRVTMAGYVFANRYQVYNGTYLSAGTLSVNYGGSANLNLGESSDSIRMNSYKINNEYMALFQSTVDKSTMIDIRRDNFPGNFIDCSYGFGVSNRKMGMKVQNYTNDANWYQRTCFYSSNPPHAAQVGGGGGMNYVKWNPQDGIFYIDNN